MLDARTFKELVSGTKRGAWPTVQRGTLWAASLIYRQGVALRNYRFDHGYRESTAIEVPVISVGNLTLGGTGKTPMVAWLARWFRSRNIRVTLISRGYGAAEGAPNDEAQELEHLLPDVPHLQNPKRVEAAHVATEELAAQVLLLDDAFQHRQIARDLDIVLLDATEPFGFGYLFPRGTLREPLSNLKRADIVVLTRGNMVDGDAKAKIWQTVRKHNADAIQLEFRHQPTQLLNWSGTEVPLQNANIQRIAAFCGIGNPGGFRHTLSEAGLKVQAFQEFADHHNYTREDIDFLTKWAAELPDADAIVCTHKDLVKIGLDQLAGKPLWALCVEASVSQGLAELEQRLTALLEKIPEDPYASNE